MPIAVCVLRMGVLPVFFLLSFASARGEALSTVSLSASAFEAQEGEAINLIFTRTEPLTKDLTVAITFGGTAMIDSDYHVATSLSQRGYNKRDIHFPVGIARKEVSLELNPDGRTEETETIAVSIESGPGYALDRQNSVEIRIIDKPPAEPAGNTPPQVYWTPTYYEALLERTNFLRLSVMTADYDGDVARVEFFNGPTKLGTSTERDLFGINSGVYTFIWTNPPPGEWGIRARVTDNMGGSIEGGIRPITIVEKLISPSVMEAITPTGNTKGPFRADPSPYFTDSQNTRSAAEFDVAGIGDTSIFLRLTEGQGTYGDRHLLVLYSADLSVGTNSLSAPAVEVATVENGYLGSAEVFWIDLSQAIAAKGWTKIGIRMEGLPGNVGGTTFAHVNLVAIPPKAINASPVIDVPASGDITLTTGDFYTLKVKAYDPDGEISSVWIMADREGRRAISTTRDSDGYFVLRWQPTYGQISYNPRKYYIWAADQYGKTTARFFANFTIKGPEKPILLHPILGTDATLDRNEIYLTAVGPALKNFHIESSTDLVNWYRIPCGDPCCQGPFQELNTGVVRTNIAFFRVVGE
jgi:hypothetical protein